MRKIAAIMIIVLVVACGNKKAGLKADDTFDLPAVQTHIHEMNKTYGERFRHNDTAFYNERYCRDIIIMPEQLPQITGIDSVRIFNYNEGKNKDLNIVVSATKIYGGPEVVVEEGLFQFTGGNGVMVDQGKFIAVWKQESGKWKLFREIWNTDNTPGN